MQKSKQSEKVILPNIQVYGSDCWLQAVVMLCYYNNDNYNKIINYKGDIPFLIHLRNFFNEIESLKFLYTNKHIQTLEEFYRQLATLMLSTTEKLKDDTVTMSQKASNIGDLYKKNSFYSPYDCINTINTIFTAENGSNQGIIDVSTFPALAQISYDPIESSDNILLAIALNESINQNVIFFHFPGHWTTAIRNGDGNFLYYNNTLPNTNDGKIHYFDGKQMQKDYIWNMDKLLSICPNKEDPNKEDNQKQQSSTKQQMKNLNNYSPNNQIEK